MRRVSFSGGGLDQGKVSQLTFILSAFLLNGTWLGYNVWSSELQLCGAPKADGTRWSR
jgi:meckelin